MSLFSFAVAVDEEETNLTTWSSQSTKLLISLRKENDSLFTKGKVRKNVAWQRVAAQFNATSSVKVTGEQCSNKWKKLEEKFKKTKEHNNKTGNNRKECDFQDELSEFFGDNPTCHRCLITSKVKIFHFASQSTIFFHFVSLHFV